MQEAEEGDGSEIEEGDGGQGAEVEIEGDFECVPRASDFVLSS